MDPKQKKLSQPIYDQVFAFSVKVKAVAPDAKIIVFGSQAAGTARSDSDIDVCVVTDKYTQDYHGGTVALLSIAHQFPTPMDVIPYSPDDLNNKYDPLAKEVRTYGIQII